MVVSSSRPWTCLLYTSGIGGGVDDDTVYLAVSPLDFVNNVPFVVEQMVDGASSEGKFKAKSGRIFLSDGLEYEVDPNVYGIYKVDGSTLTILDALKAVSIPAVEVHISDVDAREPFRPTSYAGMACVKTCLLYTSRGYHSGRCAEYAEL